MSFLLLLGMIAFSWYAGRQAGKAFYREENKKKGFLLIGMWLTIYTFYTIFSFS